VPPGIFLETEIEIPLEEFIAVRSATWQYRGLRNLTSDASAPRGLADFYLEPQEEGGFVAYSKAYPGAIGQGETELEALKDLYESIRLLKEVLDESR
jgi:predicted RNA binding protein YcfA (HicA-like mRNA interferase family)